MSGLQFAAAEEAIAKIDQQTVDDYHDYWESVRPQTLEGRWRRWVFSFLSFQAGWKSNVTAYKAVTREPWQSKAELTEIIAASGVGLHNARATGIWAFTALARSEARHRILASPEEVGWPSWQLWRNRLCVLIRYAKHKVISFSHEMCFPSECRVMAIDTHIRQLYDVPKGTTITESLYQEIEDHWLKTCGTYGYPASMVRHIVWDKIQERPSTRYWSHVFERDVNVNSFTVAVVPVQQ